MYVKYVTISYNKLRLKQIEIKLKNLLFQTTQTKGWQSDSVFIFLQFSIEIMLFEIDRMYKILITKMGKCHHA